MVSISKNARKKEIAMDPKKPSRETLRRMIVVHAVDMHDDNPKIPNIGVARKISRERPEIHAKRQAFIIFLCVRRVEIGR